MQLPPLSSLLPVFSRLHHVSLRGAIAFSWVLLILGVVSGLIYHWTCQTRVAADASVPDITDASVPDITDADASFEQGCFNLAQDMVTRIKAVANHFKDEEAGGETLQKFHSRFSRLLTDTQRSNPDTPAVTFRFLESAWALFPPLERVDQAINFISKIAELAQASLDTEKVIFGNLAQIDDSAERLEGMTRCACRALGHASSTLRCVRALTALIDRLGEVSVTAFGHVSVQSQAHNLDASFGQECFDLAQGKVEEMEAVANRLDAMNAKEAIQKFHARFSGLLSNAKCQSDPAMPAVTFCFLESALALFPPLEKVDQAIIFMSNVAKLAQASLETQKITFGIHAKNGDSSKHRARGALGYASSALGGIKVLTDLMVCLADAFREASGALETVLAESDAI